MGDFDVISTPALWHPPVKPENSRNFSDTAFEALKLQRKSKDYWDYGKIIPESYDWFLKGEGEDTDLIIKCKHASWKAHRVFLVKRCPFFKACLRSSCREAGTGVIELDDNSPTACGIFLEYLYTLSLKTIQASDIKYIYLDGSEVEVCVPTLKKRITPATMVGLIRMAHKYQVPNLILSIVNLFEYNIFFDPLLYPQSESLLLTLVGIRDLDESPEIRLLQHVLIRNLNLDNIYTGGISQIAQIILADHPGVAITLFAASGKMANYHSCYGESVADVSYSPFDVGCTECGQYLYKQHMSCHAACKIFCQNCNIPIYD